MTSSERTSVYRLYNANDQLLYVGIAKRFGSRWEQHANAQSWWGQVDHQTVRWCASREDALLAEKRAINEEMPVYNKVGSPWEAIAKDDGTGFAVIPKVQNPKSRRGNRHKTPLLGWHPRQAELGAWVRGEAERREIPYGAILDEAVAEYRARQHDPSVSDITNLEIRKQER